MHQLAPEPFVENVLNGMTFTSILDADADRMAIGEKLLECFSVFQGWIASPRRSRHGDQRAKERTLPSARLPEQESVTESIIYSGHCAAEIRAKVLLGQSQGRKPKSRVVCHGMECVRFCRAQQA